jgi:hypothetical protein
VVSSWALNIHATTWYPVHDLMPSTYRQLEQPHSWRQDHVACNTERPQAPAARLPRFACRVLAPVSAGKSAPNVKVEYDVHQLQGAGGRAFPQGLNFPNLPQNAFV